MRQTLQGSSRRDGERGSIMVMTAALMVGLVLAVGLCIDIAHFYMVRAELQNAADAAALSAVRSLNSSVGGLADAYAQATSDSLANTYNFSQTGISVAKVEFALDLNGTYTEWDPNNPITDPTSALRKARFVRVTTETASLTVLFSGSVLGSTHDETGVATAGMSVGLNGICNFFPVAVALTNPTPDPTPTPMTLNYRNGTGSSVTTANLDYVVLDVPDISGNGAPETANLAAGVTSICATIGGTLAFNNTQSAGPVNGPKQVADGTNTRFDTYQGGYGNSLNATTYPPDTNIQQTITQTQYFDRSPLTAPSHEGEDDRRILIMPIVAPSTYNPQTVTIIKFGAFFLRNRVARTGANAGRLEVVYLSDAYVTGSGYYDPNAGGATNLTVPVLYK